DKYYNNFEPKFFDMNRIPISQRDIKPLSAQDDFESRRLWRDVTYFLALNELENASTAKNKLEIDQRNRAKLLKESNQVYRCKFFTKNNDSFYAFNGYFK
ncbi:MAG: Oxysterol-binding protein- protein 9, partial [Paramarteilia canceri]